MSGNIFGDVFRISTFGESHGVSVGVVIDGCPSGVFFDLMHIQKLLDQRKPGFNPYVSPRKEEDIVQVLSGVFENYTTGAPICLLIKNQDADSKPYESLKNLYRPGHANFTYLQKFGHFDERGGGRASARETVTRVAAGAVADLILKHHGIKIEAFISQVGSIVAKNKDQDSSIIFCQDKLAEKQIFELLESLRLEGDSTGGVVSCQIHNIPIGLGEPVFDRFEANLAHAMLSIPATKGFEIGDGFESSRAKGSEFNDEFILKDKKPSCVTNHSGGTLGGITNGETVYFRVAFKPTSSIKKPQKTLDFNNQERTFQLDENARHDPCVAIRGVPVVKAMAALVTCDFLLKSRLNRLNYDHHNQSSPASV